MNAGVNLKKVVELPPGEDLNEWLAMHGVCAYVHVEREERAREGGVRIQIMQVYVTLYNVSVALRERQRLCVCYVCVWYY